MKIPIIIRTFSPDGGIEAAKAKATQSRVAINHLRSLNVASEIVIVIPRSPNGVYRCDEGYALGEYCREFTEDDVFIVEAIGDQDCAALNHGLVACANERRMLVISGSAVATLGAANFREAMTWFDKGALAVGIAAGPNADFIRGGGLDNAHCFWDVKALVSAGGFSLLSAPLRDGEDLTTRPYGAPEMFAIAGMAYNLGWPKVQTPFLATVEAAGERIVHTDPERALRDKKKFESQNYRKRRMLGLAGLHPGLLPWMMMK